jgi:hypothetical protein
MSYIITRNRNPRDLSPYLGAICVIDGYPWYVTGLHGPDIYQSEDGAALMIQTLRLAVEGNYDITDLDEYLKHLDSVNVWKDIKKHNNWSNMKSPEDIQKEAEVKAVWEMHKKMVDIFGENVPTAPAISTTNYNEDVPF